MGRECMQGIAKCIVFIISIRMNPAAQLNKKLKGVMHNTATC